MGVFKAAPNGDLIFESCDDAIAFVHKLAQMAKTNKQIKPCALVSCWQGGAVVTCKACPDGLAWQWIEVKPGTKVWVAPCVSKKVYKAPSGWPPGKAWVVDINGKAVPSNQMCPGGRAPQFIALDNGGYLMVCGDEAPGCMTPDGQVGCGDGQACIKCSDSSEYSCIDIADGCDGYSLEDVPECLSAAQCPCAEGDVPTCMAGKCGCAAAVPACDPSKKETWGASCCLHGKAASKACPGANNQLVDEVCLLAANGQSFVWGCPESGS